MRNLGLIIKHEISTTMGKPSFWVMTILFPAMLLGINLLSQPAIKAPEVRELSVAEEKIGFVDETGLLKTFPPSIPGGLLTRYADPETGAAALRNGAISQLVLIPVDYAKKGRLTVTMHSFNPLANTPEALFQYLIAYNLTGDEAKARLLTHPSTSLQEHTLTPRPDRNPLASALTYSVLMIFFFLITFSSSLMLNSVSREKMNRTAEVLLLSLEPRDLMLGKILGLSVVALFQMLAWAGGGILLFNRGQALLPSAALLQLPATLLVWVVAFFILGYLLYASLMGAVGALSPSLREASQMTFFIILPLMLPMLLSTAFSEDPNGILPVVLSLVPFTAPTAMLARLVLTPVPVWQIALSLALLTLTTTLIVQLAARAFRADTLLSTTAISIPRMLTEITKPRSVKWMGSPIDHPLDHLSQR